VESTAATSGTFFYKPHLGKWWHSEKQIYSQSMLLCDLSVRMQKSWRLLGYIYTHTHMFMPHPYHNKD